MEANDNEKENKNDDANSGSPIKDNPQNDALNSNAEEPPPNDDPSNSENTSKKETSPSDGRNSDSPALDEATSSKRSKLDVPSTSNINPYDDISDSTDDETTIDAILNQHNIGASQLCKRSGALLAKNRATRNYRGRCSEPDLREDSSSTDEAMPSPPQSANYLSESDSDSSDDDFPARHPRNQSPKSIAYKLEDVLNKSKPKCDIDLVRNLVYRQSGMVYGGKHRALLNAFTQRIKSSMFCVERMVLLHKLEKHRGCVNCLSFNRQGNLLVTGSDDLKVIVWNWMKRKPIKVMMSEHRSNVFQSKFVEGNSHLDFKLITAARDGRVRLIEVRPDGDSTNRIVTTHTGAVHRIAMSDVSPNEVITAGEDGAVMRTDLRDATSETLVKLICRGDSVPLYSVAAHPLDAEFCICGHDKYVRVYDKRNVKTCTKMFCPPKIFEEKGRDHNFNITCAVYNYVGTEILASYGDDDVYLFDSTQSTPGTFLHAYGGHKNHDTIKGVNFFGPRSEFIMSGSDCGNFFIWDKHTEAILQWLPADKNGVVNCLEGHPSLPIIATSGLDHDIKLWNPLGTNKPSQHKLAKCVKENLENHRPNFVQTYMRNMNRMLNGGIYNESDGSREDDDSSDSDSSDSVSDLLDLDENNRNVSRFLNDRGPCEVQ